MGVHSFWDIVGPTARPVKLESLQDKRMAVDASIWIYQFIKAMRDSEGNSIKNSHITGFFRRICKLLYFGIKPVFVFDGGVPALKRDTIKQRNEARQGKRESAQRTARKLLALQMHNDSNKNPRKDQNSEKEKSKTPDIVFRPEDDWDLPNIEGFRVSRDDARVNLNYEQEKKKKTFESSIIEDTIDSLDLDSIDPTSEAFEELPKNLQYQLLSNLRLKSRLRMGYSKEQLEEVFPDSLDFSKFQIDMVKKRNYYTQRIINMTGYHDGGASKLNDEVVNRISGQKNREYKITKTDNGWTLGLGEHDGSAANKAIELDPGIKDENRCLNNKKQGFIGMTEDEDQAEDDDEDEDASEWEDVALESTKVKDRFDYSLKAGRLPELDKTSQVVGSQSFLDKVPSEQSPVKRDRQVKAYKVAIPEENEISSGEESNDYERQFEEIEMMEAYQKSKLEQFQRERRIKEEKEKLENKIEQNKIMDETMKQHKENIEKKDMETMIPNQTEGQHNLQMILEKTNNASTISGDSFLFGGSLFNNEHSESKSLTKEKVIPETPSWFEQKKDSERISEGNVPNPFTSMMFVKDKVEPTKNSNKIDGEKYELLTGRNAQHLLEEQIKIRSLSEPVKTNDAVIAISDESDAEPSNIGASVKKVLDKQNLLLSQPDENQDDLSTSDMRESATENNNDNNDNNNNNEPTVFEYEFSEDEENDLVENIRQEEKDFNVFKNKELLNAYQPNKDVTNTAFLEDELFKQQVKDKRDSDEVTEDMVTDIQDMLSQFGIPFITAPMEAEAQCAELLALKLVDGVITDDSDVFLFGGTKIYRNMFHDRKYVEFYDSLKIAVDLGLDRKNMIDLALLLGSDYTNGIKGMGPVSSMEVIAEFGDMKKFKEWYEQGQFDREKLNNESKFEKDLRKRMVKNNILLDESFPNELVIDSYMNPEVDHDTTPFVWGFPAIDMLRNFLDDHLGWTQEKTDEILLPLIKDINNKKKNKQRAITSFFPTEYITNNNQAVSGGKRILTATSKLKKRKMK